MKIKTYVEQIKKGLSYLGGSISKNPTLPVLSGVKFVVNQNKVEIVATNLNLGIKYQFSAKSDGNGEFLVEYDVINNLIGSLPENDEINLDVSQNSVILKTTKNNTKIKVVPHEDFPTIPDVLGDSFEIEGSVLVNGIKSVYYTCLNTDIKPELSSVYIYSDNDYIYFVGTDSFRLAEKKIKNKDNVVLKGILIPYKNAIEIVKILSNFEQEKIYIIFNKNQISFSVSGLYITSRLIDGIYPDYRQIIPKEFKTVVTILKDDITASIKISSIFSDKFFKTNIKINSKENKVLIKTENSDLGEQETVIDCKVNGQDFDINFHYKNFIDCLQSIKDESINISIFAENKPLIINGYKDDSFVYLLMPMNK